MKRDAILEFQQKRGVRPSVFNRITKGPPPSFKNKERSRKIR